MTESVCFLEFGSNSLKSHLVETRDDGTFSTATEKSPWRVAHHFYSRGRFDPQTCEHLLSTLRDHLRAHPRVSFCLATGVFRELPHIHLLNERLHEEFGIHIRVISGVEEARLLSRAHVATCGQHALLIDLGGATTEWAFSERRVPTRHGSLALGAVRNLYAVPRGSGPFERWRAEAAAFCDERLAGLPSAKIPTVAGVGGTVKAIARTLRHDSNSRAVLARLIESVGRDGPPSFLKPSRREVFLPGIVIVDRLLEHFDAMSIEFVGRSTPSALALRVSELLVDFRPVELPGQLFAWHET